MHAPSGVSHCATCAAAAEVRTTPHLAAYSAEPPPAAARSADQLSELLTIRLTPGMVAGLRRLAKRKGLNASTLARMWIVEQLALGAPAGVGK
jgi:hypothetical protein